VDTICFEKRWRSDGTSWRAKEVVFLNEIAQWVAIALIGFLILGVLRQVSLLLPPAARAAGRGLEVGMRLPKSAMSRLMEVVPDHRDAELLVAFVTENCSGCQQLLGSLGEWKQALDGRSLVLVTRSASPQFRAAIAEIGVPILHDDGGRVWKAAHVTATPLVLRMDREGRVSDREVTHRVDLVATSMA
jgi:hypothetical protein